MPENPYAEDTQYYQAVMRAMDNNTEELFKCSETNRITKKFVAPGGKSVKKSKYEGTSEKDAVIEAFKGYVSDGITAINAAGKKSQAFARINGNGKSTTPNAKVTRATELFLSYIVHLLESRNDVAKDVHSLVNLDGKVIGMEGSGWDALFVSKEFDTWLTSIKRANVER